MADREKVIKGLEYCTGNHLCSGCGYYDPDNARCQKDLMRDALELLKEQKAIVRCKDCRYLNEDSGICVIGIMHGYRDTWFCAYGKRR